MPKICDLCGRGTTTAFNVSHSKVKTKRTQGINLHYKRINGKKKRICAKCLKTLNKKKNTR